MLIGVTTEPFQVLDLHAQWRIAPGARLQFRYWDDECVLYHGAAGNTHRVPDLVGRVLERLLVGAATTAALSEDVDLDAGDVQSSLLEMCSLGIAERVA